MLKANSSMRLLGRRILFVAIPIIIGLAPEPVAQTKTLTFMVKDINGGLASSQASPGAPGKIRRPIARNVQYRQISAKNSNPLLRPDKFSAS